jgi:hypothetical protein
MFLPLQAGQPAAAVPLLTAAYEVLTQLDLDAAGDDAAELATLTAEVQATGAQVGPLAWHDWPIAALCSRTSIATRPL